MKRKIFIILGCFVVGILLFGIVFTILVLTNNFYEKKEVFISPNKEYKIVIKGNGPKWAFGDEDIKVYSYKNNFIGFFDKTIYKTKISNDGKNLNSSNFLITWENNKAYLTLIGEEQNDERLKITFGDKITIERITE